MLSKTFLFYLLEQLLTRVVLLPLRFVYDEHDHHEQSPVRVLVKHTSQSQLGNLCAEESGGQGGTGRRGKKRGEMPQRKGHREGGPGNQKNTTHVRGKKKLYIRRKHMVPCRLDAT